MTNQERKVEKGRIKAANKSKRFVEGGMGGGRYGGLQQMCAGNE